MKNKAFTLIELLVVISIIAIIAALAIPTIAGAIEHGRSISDLSNLKQLGLGLTQYLNENDGDLFDRGGSKQWPDLVHAYVPDWRAYQSPFDRRPLSSAAPYNVSYGINDKVYGFNTGKFKHPSQLIVAGPVAAGAAALTFTGLSTNPSDLIGGSSRGEYKNRSQVNALFSDAHTSSMNLAVFNDVGTPAGMDHWIP